jgi:hypothetical protein
MAKTKVTNEEWKRGRAEWEGEVKRTALDYASLMMQLERRVAELETEVSMLHDGIASLGHALDKLKGNN